MTYTITQNTQYNSIEIAFDGKPSEAVRSALKSLRFRWHKVKKIWYGYTDAETATKAIEEATAGGEAKETPAATKDAIRVEYAKIWDTPDMVDYCTNKVAVCAVLPSGELIPIDKRKIETRFCFGESGYDYEEAIGAAAHARTSTEYFKHENMKHFGEILQDIENHLHLTGNYLMTIFAPYDDTNCKIRHISFERITKILGDLGGSAHLDSLKLGQTITEAGSGRQYRIATDEEAQIILDAYKKAAFAHAKKVDAYLKRYGLSKVHSWTYWRDA